MEQLSNLRWQLNKAGRKVLPRGRVWQRLMKKREIMPERLNSMTKLSKKILLPLTHT